MNFMAEIFVFEEGVIWMLEMVKVIKSGPKI